MDNKERLVYVFWGDGKGKTSAALGVAIRMLLSGKKVEWISWFKEKSWKTAEMDLPKVFEKNLRMHWMGSGFFGGPMDRSTPLGHKRAAEKGFKLAKDILIGKDGARGIPDLLVLDEILTAVREGLLTIEEVLEIVKIRKTHVIMTGQVCPNELTNVADLVTEMKKVKHPYDKGVLAVQGLDF